MGGGGCTQWSTLAGGPRGWYEAGAEVRLGWTPRDLLDTVRRRFITSDPSELSRNDHVAWCGDGPDQFYSVAVSAFSAATDRGEQMLLASHRPDPQRLAALDDLERLMRRGALHLASVEETYRE